MPEQPDNLTLLIRPGEKLLSSRGLPQMRRVSDPGPSFARLRKFFRPWRLAVKALLIGLPCWVGAMVVYLGGFLAGLTTGLTPLAELGMGTAAGLALLPFGILALWAGLLALHDLTDWPANHNRAKAYNEVLARLGEADVITPSDLKSPGIREGLRTLGNFERLLASIENHRDRFSALLRDSLHESSRLIHRSVLDLIETERRLAEWSDRLGKGSAYKAKLQARRDKLVGSYAGILDQCLAATDRALAHRAEDPADLQRSVQTLLDACQRALAEVEMDGPAIDEQELLMYAAKARDEREAGAAGGPDDEAVDER